MDFVAVVHIHLRRVVDHMERMMEVDHIDPVVDPVEHHMKVFPRIDRGV